MIKQLAHVCIHAKDLEETMRFYCGALGLEQGFEFVKNGERFGFYIKLGRDTFIEVFQGPSKAVGNINHIAIQVDDLDGLIRRIASHGYTIGEKKLGADSSWQAWTEDPNGVRIEFHEYTDDSLQRRGGVCAIGQ